MQERLRIRRLKRATLTYFQRQKVAHFVTIFTIFCEYRTDLLPSPHIYIDQITLAEDRLSRGAAKF